MILLPLLTEVPPQPEVYQYQSPPFKVPETLNVDDNPLQTGLGDAETVPGPFKLPRIVIVFETHDEAQIPFSSLT